MEKESIAQWVIDNRYPKSEKEKVSDKEIYDAIQSLQEERDRLRDIQKSVYEIDFNGKFKLKCQGMPTQLIAAMDGFGNAVDLSEITIAKQSLQSEE